MPADPRRVKELFVAALELPDPQARQAFLDRECGDDADLRRRLEVLLSAHDRPDSALEKPLAATGDEPNPAESVGTIVAGRYKLLEPIGEGGMGTVWMAEQTDPVKRLVAVKLIKPGMDSRTVLARFEAERQALALMDHPNIAKVHDGGTERGRPYFVMELVKGIPLTDYCDERRLTVSERLDLFVHVCSAVQHAHQKGLIHRDIKPSNILVTEHDGRPVPKVIDFGLAKALNRTSVLTDRTLHTAYGTVVGTPLYMAPEQVGINALDVDTRADVYALGVILYELLTGTTPLERKRFKEAAWEEAKRLIREEEPPKPSTRLSASDALPAIAARRHAEPARLNRLVRGELDWIVMKALEKDRNRRYETANGLARDVQRYLADEVVEARPPSAGYRVRKFVRRYKKPLATAAAFGVLLVLGLAVSIWQVVRARAAEGQARSAQMQAESDRDRATKAEADVKTERDTAVAEKRRADELAAIAQAVNDFLQRDLLMQADSRNQPIGVEHDPNVKVRTLLDRAAKNVELRFADKPLMEAAIRLTVGNTYWGLGDFDEAQRHLERSVQLRSARLGANHEATLFSKFSLAIVYGDQRNDDRAEPLFREVLQALTDKLGPSHPQTVSTKNSLAWRYVMRGIYDRPEKLLLEVLKANSVLPAEHPAIVLTKDYLAAVYFHQGKYYRAEPLLLEVLRVRSVSPGADHPETVSGKIYLARVYLSQGKDDRAEKLFLEVLQTLTGARGADHFTTLNVKSYLALLYGSRGEYDRAELLFQEIVKASTATLGANDPVTRSYVSHLQWCRRRRAKAEPFQQVLRAKGVDHPDTLAARLRLLADLRSSSMLLAAEPHAQAVLETRRRTLGEDHPDTLASQVELGAIRVLLWKHAEAEPLMRDCEARCAKQLQDSWLMFNAQSLLGGSLLGQGLEVASTDPAAARRTFAEAEPLLVQGYEGLKRHEAEVPVGSRRHVIEAAGRLVQLYDEWGKPDQAAAWRERRIKDFGFIRDWLILSPVPLTRPNTPSTWDEELIRGEARLRPKEGDVVRIGDKQFVWKQQHASDAAIDFNALAGQQTTHSAAYAVCYVIADAERKDLRLLLGSDDQAKVYLNGQEVFKHSNSQMLEHDLYTVEGLTLRPGTNVLIFKVVNNRGNWEGCLRFVEKDGRPTQNLQVTLAP